MTIPYIRNFDPDYGKFIRISKNVRRLVANNPGPFTAWGTNVYCVGKGDVNIIDPGPDTDEHFEILITALRDEQVCRVFVTHHHLDHSPMANRLAAHFGCQTYGFGPPKQPPGQGNHGLEAGDDRVFTPAIKVKDGQVYDGDGWTIEAVHTPGHVSNHVCYAIENDNGLVCGDHIMAWSTSVISPPDGDMADYLHSLHKVLERKYTTLWPGHGAAITRPQAFILAYIAHRHARTAQILAQLGQGQCTIKAMVATLYADCDKALYPAASHSVLAHMIQLVKTGKVTCAGSPGLDSQYTLA